MKNKNVINILQITDMHLFSDKAATLHGNCTYKSFSNTVDHIISCYNEKFDIAIVTGDVSQDESLESYALALHQLERLGVPIYWIFGNHDDEYKIKSIFNTSRVLKQLTKITTGFWDFISLNTSRPGTAKGYIDSADFSIFAENVKISQLAGKNIAIIMHHHPYPVNTPLVDECMLQNDENFFRLITETEQIKLIICGHVHGDYKILNKNHVLETCPATCFQWNKGTDNVEIENRSGFKIHRFNKKSHRSSTIFI
ncbi:metallophosphoesterase [Glaciimonas immobilis]|uniref:Icc protein n=1 Tax=Glaciimonas immobilis TaxID=728004 RepID=A0A840RSH4_9BURK|nr:metallophosphoesterase [Glaciimonas immobilis]KAF3997106.1 phosphohydrolase [Glaciimonas immobilis]MBB5199968.1 Icc protein [Glaciimonas immobilis]